MHIGIRVLLEHVLKALQNLSDAKEALDALKGIQRGRVKIAITTTARYFIPKLIKQFNDMHEDIEVQMEMMNRSQVIDSLATGAVDLAVMGRAPKRITVQSEIFAEHPYVIVAHPQHPLVGQKRISPADLAGEVFLQREEGSGTRKLMHYFFASNDIVSPRGNVVGGNESIKQSVMAGLGIAFISRHAISHELTAGRLAILQVKNLPIIRTWNLLRPVNKPSSAITQTLADFIKAEAPSELADMSSAI
jgi:LysR family transcriptional regulator for metE and metH